jgi:peroxiredoxin
VVSTHDPTELPADLPVPQDDGAADHLPGSALPALALPSTTGADVALATIGSAVLFCYPKTGRPGVAMPAGWDDIPGARGCTPEACGFRDLAADFDRLGLGLYGVSTQPTAYQREAAERLRLPYPLLSDAELRLTRAIRLPTMDVEGETLIRRLTMLVRDNRIEHVWYPVFPPDTHADDVLGWF